MEGKQFTVTSNERDGYLINLRTRVFFFFLANFTKKLFITRQKFIIELGTTSGYMKDPRQNSDLLLLETTHGVYVS